MLVQCCRRLKPIPNITGRSPVLPSIISLLKGDRGDPEKAIEKSLDTGLIRVVCDDVVSTALIEGPGPGGQREGRHLRFCWCGDVEGRNLMCGLDWLRGVLSPCWRV